MKRLTLLVGVFLLIALNSRAPADDKSKVSLGAFTALEVENFQNPPYETKEAMPNEWLPLIREDIVQRVIEKHRFHRVMDFHDPKVAEPGQERVLILRGKILEFTHGSQAKRVLIGLGAGKGKIVARCDFIDKQTGELVWSRKVDGRVIGAMQPTEGAIKGLSKEVAKVIDQRW